MSLSKKRRDYNDLYLYALKRSPHELRNSYASYLNELKTLIDLQNKKVTKRNRAQKTKKAVKKNKTQKTRKTTKRNKTKKTLKGEGLGDWISKLLGRTPAQSTAAQSTALVPYMGPDWDRMVSEQTPVREFFEFLNISPNEEQECWKALDQMLHPQTDSIIGIIGQAIGTAIEWVRSAGVWIYNFIMNPAATAAKAAWGFVSSAFSGLCSLLGISTLTGVIGLILLIIAILYIKYPGLIGGFIKILFALVKATVKGAKWLLTELFKLIGECISRVIDLVRRKRQMVIATKETTPTPDTSDLLAMAEGITTLADDGGDGNDDFYPALATTTSNSQPTTKDEFVEKSETIENGLKALKTILLTAVGKTSEKEIEEMQTNLKPQITKLESKLTKEEKQYVASLPDSYKKFFIGAEDRKRLNAAIGDDAKRKRASLQSRIPKMFRIDEEPTLIEREKEQAKRRKIEVIEDIPAPPSPPLPQTIDRNSLNF